MNRKTVYVRTGNKADQLLKTPTNQRGTYKYRFHETETVSGKTRDITEEIEIIPGKDGVTEEDIKVLYAAEDSEVYYNIKARRPPLEDWQKDLIEKFKQEYIAKSVAKYVYAPSATDLQKAVNEQFPKNWTASLDELTSADDDDESIGDKSSILANAWYAMQDDEESPVIEELNRLVSTWSESWQEIYRRVLLNKETIVSIARTRGVTEGAVRKTVNKIRAAIANDEKLKKLYLRG